MSEQDYCQFHPDRRSAGICHRYGRGFCDECLEFRPECPDPEVYCKYRRRCLVYYGFDELRRENEKEGDMEKKAAYSDFIKSWPKAKLPFDGATGHLMKSDYGQVVLFELPKGVEVPLHHHGAQWGLVVEGQLKLTIGDKTKVYEAGDSYQIQEGQEHGGVTLTDCRVIDVFQEADRYQAG